VTASSPNGFKIIRSWVVPLTLAMLCVAFPDQRCKPPTRLRRVGGRECDTPMGTDGGPTSAMLATVQTRELRRRNNTGSAGDCVTWDFADLSVPGNRTRHHSPYAFSQVAIRVFCRTKHRHGTG
jgi:hypothetical protein